MYYIRKELKMFMESVKYAKKVEINPTNIQE